LNYRPVKLLVVDVGCCTVGSYVDEKAYESETDDGDEEFEHFLPLVEFHLSTRNLIARRQIPLLGSRNLLM
jgi:hypothetical protein